MRHINIIFLAEQKHEFVMIYITNMMAERKSERRAQILDLVIHIRVHIYIPLSQVGSHWQ